MKQDRNCFLQDLEQASFQIQNIIKEQGQEPAQYFYFVIKVISIDY